MSLFSLMWLGCSSPGSFSVVGSGQVFFYNDDVETIQVAAGLRTSVDCMVLDHPALATLVSPATPAQFDLPAQHILALFEDELYETTDRCMVAGLEVEGQGASLVLDYTTLSYQDHFEDVQRSDLGRNTLLYDSRRSPSFVDGGFDVLGLPEESPPTCSDASIPTWTGSSQVGTLLAIHENGACTTLSLSAGADVTLCNAPSLPYLVGEDLEIEISERLFSMQTVARGKPFLITSDPDEAPSWLGLERVWIEEGYSQVAPSPCVYQGVCGPMASVEFRVMVTERISEGESVRVRNPEGANRDLHMYRGAASMDLFCGVESMISLVPATPGD